MSNVQAIKENIEKIDQCLPSWHRGLSFDQLTVCENLISALRDDTEQRTTFRVENSMYYLGIRPLPTSKQVAFIMKLSRANDLAFLYFLMKTYYRKCKRRYCVSQQLLMSAICHLDLTATIRELDRVLPPGHVSHTPQERQLKVVSEKSKTKATMQKGFRTASAKRRPARLPYFQKQPRPLVLCNAKKFLTTERDYAAPLTFYDSKKLLRMPNAKRWYADYNLQPSKRMVKQLLQLEIGKLFERVDAASIAGSEKRDESKSMCKYHRNSRDIEKDKFVVEAKERCLKLVDVVGKKKALLQNRIRQQLEKDVDFYVAKYRKNWKCHWALVPTIKGKNCRYCQQKVFELQQPTHANQTEANLITLLMGDCDHATTTTPLCCQSEADETANTDNVRCVDDSCGVNSLKNCTNENVDDDAILREHGKILQQLFSSYNEQQTKLYNAYSHDKQKLEHKFKYFRAAEANQPYTFDYQTIFVDEAKERSTTELIKTAAVKAINVCSSDTETDSQQLSNLVQLKADERECVLTAINRCVQNIWRRREDDCQQNVCPAEESADPNKLYYEQSEFDPNNKKLMTKLLYDGINLIRQDRNLVLASFPDVHKLPILREWIKQRYGMRYKSLSAAQFDRFRRRFNMLANCRSEINPQILVDFRTKDWEYDQIKEAQKEAFEVKSQYLDFLNYKIMHKGRLLWYLVEPFTVYNGPPRNQFFAYFPPMERAILHRGDCGSSKRERKSLKITQKTNDNQESSK